MPSAKNNDDCEFGSQLLASISIPENKLNILFSALLLTAAAVFGWGNFLMQDVLVMQATAPIAFTCLGLLLIFYAVSKSLNSVTWGLVLTYCLMWLVTYSRLSWLVPLFYTLAVFGLLYAIRFLRIEVKELGLVVLMALIATAIILGCKGMLTSFDMLQRLGAGDAHPDTLFHASIASMIKNYGVVSTGLNGLIKVSYHVLSHELIASISVLSGAGVFEIYGVASQILFIPILIFSVVACCLALDAQGRTNIAVAWACTCVLFALIPWLFNQWAVWDSFFVSESYLIALGLLLLALPVLFKEDLALTDLLLATILAALIVNAKSSVGLIYAGLWVLRMLVLRSKSFYIVLLTSALVGLVVLMAMLQMASANVSMKIIPFEFIHSYAFRTGKMLKLKDYFLHSNYFLQAVVVIFFFIFHFLFSWIVVARMAYSRGWRSLTTAPIVVYSMGAVAAGATIISLFEIPGGAAYYFSNIAFFVSLPLVIILLSSGYTGWQKKINIGEKKAAFIFLAFALLLTIYMGAEKFTHTAVVHKVYANESSPFADSLIGLRHQSSMNEFFRPAPAFLSSNPQKLCWAQPFVYPAISERPWTGIIRLDRGCLYENYGYIQYDLPTQNSGGMPPPKFMRGMKERTWPNS